MHVAIIGAGYAGMAAATELTSLGVAVTVFEATRTLGGRARRVETQGHVIDNGQHILIGAYNELLRLMRVVGVRRGQLLARQPLNLNFPRRMQLTAPPLPAPLHLAAALLTARGLSFPARLGAVRFMRRMQKAAFRLERDVSFAELMERHDQHPSVVRHLWQPLCLAALNTLPGEASAQVFLNVLRDSLAGPRQASDLLLPRSDLSGLFPEPAEAYVIERGGQVRRGAGIRAVRWSPYGFRLEGDDRASRFSHVVCAVAPYQLAPLLAQLPRLQALCDDVARLDYEPILTAYLAYRQPISVPRGMIGLSETAHFLIQKDARTLAAVISARGRHLDLPRAELVARIHAEIRSIFGEVADPLWSRVIVEKRATIACRPGTRRPDVETPLANFYLCGDYIASDYPATLESAVRSGVRCARLIGAQVGRHPA